MIPNLRDNFFVHNDDIATALANRHWHYKAMTEIEDFITAPPPSRWWCDSCQTWYWSHSRECPKCPWNVNK